MSARETILDALRHGAFDAALPAVYAGDARVAGVAQTAVVPPPDAQTATLQTVRALTARFIERAVDVGTDVHLITSVELPGAIVAAVMETSERDVVIWEDPLLDACAQALRTAGATVISGEAETQENVAAASFGLTTVDDAIAETGTLVLGGGPGRSRSTSLLPAHHLAVLPEARIRADLFDLMGDLGPSLPSALTFITGPSRTADIGLTPVRPAHGPVSVTVFVVSETGD